MNAVELVKNLQQGDRRALSRCISLVENDAPQADLILENMEPGPGCRVIGITGPPGAGKSTLVNALLGHYSRSQPGIKIAVLAIDPTSPFTHGSLLGDRLRMNEHFDNPNIFIRSLATRGALGGLSAKTIEITDVIRSAGFNLILVETVGVGQSEVEIASLADTTLVVFVPESGDEIQTIKSGIMEIADIFVVNKSDREGADRLVKNLSTTLHDRKQPGWMVPVIKTTATSGNGIDQLAAAIEQFETTAPEQQHRKDLIFDRVVRLYQSQIFKRLDINKLRIDFEKARNQPGFNIYRFVATRVAATK